MKKIISRLYRHPENFMNWLKGRKGAGPMDVTIDNITMKRINLDVAEVKEAIMVYVASYMNPKLTITEIDKAEVYVRRDGTAQVEIIIDSVPDMPDIAPPCIETPGGAGPMHPEQIMKNLEQGFSKNQLADKED